MFLGDITGCRWNNGGWCTDHWGRGLCHNHTVNQTPCSILRHKAPNLRTARSETVQMIYWDCKKKTLGGFLSF